MTTTTKGTTMKMTEAVEAATILTDPNHKDFDPIDFHNVAMVSEVIATLTSSAVAANRVLGHDLYTALNFYFIGRNTIDPNPNG